MMRALPLIERLLVVVLVAGLVVVLAFLLTWHVRWRAMLVDPGPRPGETVMVTAPPMPEAVGQAYVAWCGRMEGLEPWRPEIPILIGQLHDLLRAGLGGDAIVGLRQTSSRGDRLGDDRYGKECEYLRTAAERWNEATAQRERVPVALADLDALLAACTSPDGFRSGTWGYVCEMRDDAYVRTALFGTAPADALQRWRDMPLDPLAMQVRKMEDERRDLREEWARKFALGPFALARDGRSRGHRSWFDTWRYGIPFWWSVPAEAMKSEAWACGQIDAVIQRQDIPNGPWVQEYRATGQRIMSDPPIALHLLFQHRLAVLAVQVLAARTSAGILPESITGLDLAAGSDRLALVLRHDEHRFDIQPDSAVVQQGYLVADWTTNKNHGLADRPICLNDFAVKVDLSDPGVQGWIQRAQAGGASAATK